MMSNHLAMNAHRLAARRAEELDKLVGMRAAMGNGLGTGFQGRADMAGGELGAVHGSVTDGAQGGVVRLAVNGCFRILAVI